jgi:hypothetical protein
MQQTEITQALTGLSQQAMTRAECCQPQLHVSLRAAQQSAARWSKLQPAITWGCYLRQHSAAGYSYWQLVAEYQNGHVVSGKVHRATCGQG